MLFLFFEILEIEMNNKFFYNINYIKRNETNTNAIVKEAVGVEYQRITLCGLLEG